MTRSASWLMLYGLLGASVLISETSLADETPPASTLGKAKAAAEYTRRGQRARDAGRWADAEVAFELALEAGDPERTTEAQRAELLGELGLCELKQRKYRDAAEHLAKSLEQYKLLRPEIFRRVNAGNQRALSHVGRLYVAVSPSDAAVLLDGRPLGRALRAYELFVEPGWHTIRARLAGYGDGVATLDVAAGAKQGAALTLSRAPEPPPAAKAIPVATSKARRASPLGRARAPGTWAGWPGKLRIAGIAFTTASLSTGALFMIRSSVLEGDLYERIDGLNDQPGWNSGSCLPIPQPEGCSELHRLRVARDLFGRVGTGLIVAGGVVGAATVASFFTDFAFLRSKPAQAGFTVVPAMEAHQVGLVALGVW